MSHTGTPRKPSLNKELDVAKKITVFQNGNTHFAGCETYLNPKHYPNPNIFMDHLTNLIPKKGGRNKGCIRKLYTKSGRRIHAFSQISNGGEIVAAGDEDFQKYSYQNIPSYKTPRKGQRQSRNNSSIFSRWYKENNFTHQRNSRYDDIKPRFNETGEPGVRIYVHKNDQPNVKTVLVLLKQKRLEHLNYALEDITKELYQDSKYPVRFVYNIKGEQVTKPSDFQHEEFYVAVPPTQMFKKCAYGCRTRDLPNFTINPFVGVGIPHTAYLWQDPNSSRPTTWTSRHNHVPPISKPSPNQSVASHPETSLRRRKIHQTQEDVHQKAIKHQRTPEKRVQQVDYDQDNSNVFRAKKENKSTKGAKEVKESRETKTDLPIDQVKAEEVEEELLPPAHHHLTPLELNCRPSDEDQDYAKEDYYGYDKDDRRSPRGHPYTKERSERDLNPYKVLDPIKKDQRSSTPVKDDDDDDEERKRKEDEAATKIQASFRGHQARQEIADMKIAGDAKKTENTTTQREDTKDSLDKDAENKAAAKIQAGFRGYQTRQELKAKGHKVRPPIAANADSGEDKKVSKEKEDEAATKIQASFRGYQARKEVKQIQEEKKKNEAATVIQANFKGYKVRKEQKEQREGGQKKEKESTQKKEKESTQKKEKESTQKKEKESTQKKADKKPLDKDEAATKIQASFRGYQTRKQFKQEKEQGAGIASQGSETVISTPPHSSEAPGINSRA